MLSGHLSLIELSGLRLEILKNLKYTSVMTQGKADTIVLAYYIYNLAFSDQFQLGLASAVAWIMFAMIFVMTAINFRFGSQMTNE